jgi:hypothetical protein
VENNLFPALLDRRLGGNGRSAVRHDGPARTSRNKKRKGRREPLRKKTRVRVIVPAGVQPIPSSLDLQPERERERFGGFASRSMGLLALNCFMSFQREERWRRRGMVRARRKSLGSLCRSRLLSCCVDFMHPWPVCSFFYWESIPSTHRKTSSCTPATMLPRLGGSGFEAAASRRWAAWTALATRAGVFFLKSDGRS